MNHGIMEGLFKQCEGQELFDTESDELIDYDRPEYMPCQNKMRLKPEDEISVDSIISELIAIAAPEQDEFAKCSWDVDAKQMLNEKQALIFEEHLYISRLKDTNCKLTEVNKVFLERELEEVGDYCLNIEESYDGFVVYSKSKMVKSKGEQKCGHILKGKYTDRFLLICEKRMEFDYIDKARIEKLLDARTHEHELFATRETKVNGESQKFKTVINIKGRDNIFVLDGGVMLFMRHLIINNFRGDFEYYSMNLFGKIVRCTVSILEERKKVRLFYRNFDNVICVHNKQYFNDVEEVVSETFYQANGRIILHFWHNYNYLLHNLRAPMKPVERILPKLELMWKADDLLFKKYKHEKKLNFANATEYLNSQPELSDFLNDYIATLLKYKPPKVFDFSIKYFQNLKKSF